MEKRKVLGFTRSTMEVNVYQVTITTSLSKKTLTKAVAKQFPIKWGSDRSDQAFTNKPQPEALCKVQAAVLEKDAAGWLVLAEDPIAGLAWFRPVVGDKKWTKAFVGSGRWVDDLSQVPTAIL